MLSKPRLLARRAAAPVEGEAARPAATCDAIAAIKRYTGGRPSQEEAVRRDARLVEIAAHMFMERGFEATTIDAVADAAGVGKATLYARYRDKAALFEAVFQRQIDRWVTPLCAAAACPTTIPLEDALLAISRRMMEVALTPESIMVHRILMAEANRFPEMARVAHELGWRRSNTVLAKILQHFAEDGQIAVADPELAAEQFISLVVGRQTRVALLGLPSDPAQVDERVRAAVALFLRAVRPGA